jgi:murein DD-endopeptidase MepM/ murein hydrolase activator NlpD
MLLAQGPAGGSQSPDVEAPPAAVKVNLSLPARPKSALAAPLGAEEPAAEASAEVAIVPAKVEIPEPAAQPRPRGEWIELEVKRGDSLDRLFRRHGLSVADLARLLKVKEVAHHLKKIRPGDLIEITHDGETVLSLVRRVDETRSLVVEAADEGYRARYIDHPIEIRTRKAWGRINSSFYVAGLETGMSDTAIMELAGVFAWDIDFALDIRRNDWFAVVYEELWQDGEKLRDGNILAAEFGNDGRVYRAVRFVDPDGRAEYYAPDGKSMRKAFLRAPVDFTRVSSNFNPNRLHPILKVKRPHQGVDYAARAGTPIKAAGDGKVIHAGTKGGYGTTVVLQHGGNVTTLYAHMSRIAPSVRVGRRVNQGQTIGYVGKSGLATAPHLHYEYRLNGVHRNPRTVPLPEAEPVPASLRAQFAAASAPLLAELETLSPTRLAAAD